MALKGEAKANYMREWMRKKRLDPVYRAEENKRSRSVARVDRGGKRLSGECQVCGYRETTDMHHEGEDRQEYILCPNHHALITRGIKTLEDMITNHDNVRPNPTPRAEKLARLRALIADPGALRDNPSPPEEESNTIPRYNPRHPQIGEMVRMPSGLEVIARELDGDGNVIPDY